MLGRFHTYNKHKDNSNINVFFNLQYISKTKECTDPLIKVFYP